VDADAKQLIARSYDAFPITARLCARHHVVGQHHANRGRSEGHVKGIPVAAAPHRSHRVGVELHGDGREDGGIGDRDRSRLWVAVSLHAACTARWAARIAVAGRARAVEGSILARIGTLPLPSVGFGVWVPLLRCHPVQLLHHPAVACCFRIGGAATSHAPLLLAQALVLVVLHAAFGEEVADGSDCKGRGGVAWGQRERKSGSKTN
jgi:hypothetical protein